MPAGIRNQEFENLNRYRSYPFSESSSMLDSEGVALPCDVFSDAVLYPVNGSGGLFMSALDCIGRTVEVSDASGVVMVGSLAPEAAVVDLYQNGRHAGTIATGPGFDREMAAGRRRVFEGTAEFAASAVCPIRHDGVSSIVFDGRAHTSEARTLKFAGRGRLVARSGIGADGEPYMWFDVRSSMYSSPSPGSNDQPEDGDTPISRIHVVGEAGSLFMADMESSSRAYLFLRGMDRDDVCSRAHLADRVAIVRDTCENPDQESCTPDDGGGGGGGGGGFRMVLSGCGVTLDTSDLVDYLNPVRIGPTSGDTVPNAPSISPGDSHETETSEAHKLIESSTVVGGGITISIPGVPDA